MSPLELDRLLNRYRIECRPAVHSETTAAYTWELPGDLSELLQAFGRLIQSPDKKVSGSLFMKRCCSLVSGVLYAWTHHRAAWIGGLAELRVELRGQGLIFHLPEPSILAETADPLPVLDHLMGEWVSPLLRQVAHLTGVREANLWSTLSYNLTYWEREWAREGANGDVLARMQEAFRLLREPGRTGWFPGPACTCSTPLAGEFRQVANPFDAGKPILIRTTCCTNYRLPGEDRYCYTCPLLSEEQRMVKVEAVYGTKTQATVG